MLQPRAREDRQPQPCCSSRRLECGRGVKCTGSSETVLSPSQAGRLQQPLPQHTHTPFKSPNERVPPQDQGSSPRTFLGAWLRHAVLLMVQDIPLQPPRGTGTYPAFRALRGRAAEGVPSSIPPPGWAAGWASVLLFPPRQQPESQQTPRGEHLQR